jgi:phage/plasmid-associated DNA primase
MNKKLRVSHFPQIPCKPFIVEVKTLEEAKKIIDVLADYDLFQYENNIKPDYCNTSVLEEYCEEENEWYDWCDDETGIDDLDEYFEFINEEKSK